MSQEYGRKNLIIVLPVEKNVSIHCISNLIAGK